jgi:hypothetical protein
LSIKYSVRMTSNSSTHDTTFIMKLLMRVS